MQDEAFHEIQLNGKQLVFLFMAATVVSVVIFLCGVMVGRGVQTPRGDQVAAASQNSLDPTTSAVPPPPATATDSGIVTSQETLTYPGRLEDPNPPAETLKAPTVARAAPDPLPEPEPEPIPEPTNTTGSTAAPVAAVATTSTNEPAGNGFVVQVAAVRQRAEADTIARRLSAKGYPAFVTTPAGAANVFRVRVGKFTDRRQAESVADRLEKEEQFKPWITR